MTKEISIAKVFDRLNRFLSNTGVPLRPADVLYAMDASVVYSGTEREIRMGDTFGIDRLEELIDALPMPGPSWAHFNVIPTKKSNYLVTIVMSRSMTGVRPSINVSSELNRAATIKE